MGNAFTVLRKWSAAWTVLLLVAVVAVVAAAGSAPAWAVERKVVEMPAAFQTEGLTVEEQLQRQAELSAWLLADLSGGVAPKEVRIGFLREEIDALDQADRSAAPLRVGLVKAMTPPVVLFGLDRPGVKRVAGQGATGLAHPTPDGGFVWALSVAAEGAGAVRLHVEDLSLPPGVELYVYSRTGEAYGPYTGAGPDQDGDLWTTAVFGSEAILQVRASGSGAEASIRNVSLRVSEVGIITPRFAESTIDAIAANFCGNPSCIVDASCYSGANSIKDAYAKMEWISGLYIYTCTGALLNDSNPTQNNYFLTANHCLSKSSTAKNVSFYWRFRTSTCNGTCPSNTGWPYKTTGAAVRSSNRRGDYTLMQLNSNPPAGSVFLGWTSTPVANTNGVALHRVSNPNFGPQVYSEQTVSTSAPTCTGWPRGERIYSRVTLGGTDGGSSGSPVVNASDQVVGQLSGACGTNPSDPCDRTNNATVDGAFAYYWASVQPYLAP